jgi:hypothetical protein
MTHASIDHLAGGTANSTSTVGDSLSRADWPASPRSGSAGRDVTIQGCFTAWQSFGVLVNSVLHFMKSDTFFWLPRRYSLVGTLADALSKKTRGVGASYGRNKDRARVTQTVDDEVPVRHLGSMGQGHISHNK